MYVNIYVYIYICIHMYIYISEIKVLIRIGTHGVVL